MTTEGVLWWHQGCSGSCMLGGPMDPTCSSTSYRCLIDLGSGEYGGLVSISGLLLCSSEQCLRCVRAHCPAGTSGSVDVMSRSCLTWSVVDSSSAWRLPGQWPHLETPLDMFNKTTGQFAAMFVATKEGISSQNMIISLHSTAFSQHETENWSHRNPTLQHYSY